MHQLLVDIGRAVAPGLTRLLSCELVVGFVPLLRLTQRLLVQQGILKVAFPGLHARVHDNNVELLPDGSLKQSFDRRAYKIDRVCDQFLLSFHAHSPGYYPLRAG